MGFIFLSIFAVIVCVALIAITMVQNSKKEDEGNTLGSLGVHVLMGVKQTNNFLTGTTWILMSLLFVICLGFHHIKKDRGSNFVSPNLEILKKQVEGEKVDSDVKKVNENEKDDDISKNHSEKVNTK